MTSDGQSNTTHRIGLCIDCNYPLQGLPTHRCPECGRAFDPDRPATMNMGRPVGRVGRFLVRPLGWFTLLAAILATAAMLSVTRLPLGRPMNEARFYLHLAYWKTPDPARDWHDWAYLAGLLLTMGVTATFVCRVVAREILLRMRRWRRVKAGRARQMFIAMAIAINGIAISMGWPYRAGRLWVAHETVAAEAAYSAPASWPSSRFTPIASAFPLSDGDAVKALMAAATSMPKPRERLTAVQLLAHHYPKDTAASLVRLIEGERDSDVCAAEIHLYTILEHREAQSLLDRFFSDPRPQVRAAAADGIGLLCSTEPGGFQLLQPQWLYPQIGVELDGGPPPLVVDNPMWGSVVTTPPTSRQREALEKMMLTGSESVEREAAARALRPWPPAGYSLRVAEWGVWVSDGGELKLVQSVLDEIPPFVHQTGNKVSELGDRLNLIMMIDKPIIHVTSNVSMSVDLSVLIRAGRPWYAYPLPDDFAVSVATFYDDSLKSRSAYTVPLASLEKTGLRRLTEFREGYPWLVPHHRLDGPESAGGFGAAHNECISVGVRWQSLIVSPERLSWMQPPVVGNDPRFAWWEKLRGVPSCWVSSRGEADRFLYYDGPTLAKAPVAATLSGRLLHLEPDPADSKLRPRQQTPRTSPSEMAFDAEGSFVGLTQSSPNYKGRQGLFIQVSGGHVRGREISIPEDRADWPATGPEDLEGPAAEGLFRNMLLDRGLTEAEAGGLIAAWENQFFRKDGQRFLLLLSPQDYDLRCPIEIRPAPTALVRVGIVLTEF